MLRFYAVQDDFDVWDAIPNPLLSVVVGPVSPKQGQPDRTSVNININFSTKKVLMVKSSSDFYLAVSEVEFFTSTCSSKCGNISITIINACIWEFHQQNLSQLMI